MNCHCDFRKSKSDNMGDHDDGLADVPDGLIYLLVKRLVGLGNIIRFGAVCRSGHVIVSYKDQTMALGQKEVVPWLLLPESDRSEDGNREFLDLSTGDVSTLTPTSSCEKVRRFISWLVDNNRIRFAISPV